MTTRASGDICWLFFTMRREIAVQSLSDYLTLFLQICNSVVMIYLLIKFLGKPQATLSSKHDELVKKVNEHDLEIKAIKESLLQGNDKFREQAKANATFRSVMLAFVDFEIAYCLHTNYEFTDDLMRAKKELQDYMSGK